MDNATKADMAAYTGCIAGALTRDEFTDALRQAGLVDIEIQETPPRPRLSRLGGRLRGQAPRELPNQSADHLLQAPGQGRVVWKRADHQRRVRLSVVGCPFQEQAGVRRGCRFAAPPT